MIKKLATYISVVFHPLLLATYCCVFIIHEIPLLVYPIQPSLWSIILVFVVTFILPSTILFLLYGLGVIENFILENRLQRRIPLLFITTIYSCFTILLYMIFSFEGIVRFMTILSIMAICSTFITLFYKISLHSFFIGGVVGILTSFNMINVSTSLLLILTVVIVVAGLIISSRLALQAHTCDEVTTGVVIGFLIGSFGVFMLF